MRVALLGPPGAGKGTLAGSLKEKLGFLHISTGDMLRDEMASGSSLGREVKSYVDNGKLVPDDVVIKIIETKLTGDTQVKSGFMLDGFPRTITQAKDLDKILKRIRQPLQYAFYLEASLPVILQRLTGRRVCKNCGALFHIQNKPPKTENVCDECSGPLYQRPDDNEATIRTRMDVYRKNTEPIIAYYEKQSILHRLDADINGDMTFKQLMKCLDENQRPDKD